MGTKTKLDMSKFWDEVKRVVEDPTALECHTYTGKIEAFLKAETKGGQKVDGKVYLDWDGIEAASLVAEGSTVKWVVCSKVEYDGDSRLFITDDPDILDRLPQFMDAHADMIERGMDLRLRLIEWVNGIFKISIPFLF